MKRKIILSTLLIIAMLTTVLPPIQGMAQGGTNTIISFTAPTATTPGNISGKVNSASQRFTLNCYTIHMGTYDFSISGTTDANGNYSVTFNMPADAPSASYDLFIGFLDLDIDNNPVETFDYEATPHYTLLDFTVPTFSSQGIYSGKVNKASQDFILTCYTTQMGGYDFQITGTTDIDGNLSVPFNMPADAPSASYGIYAYFPNWDISENTHVSFDYEAYPKNTITNFTAPTKNSSGNISGKFNKTSQPVQLGLYNIDQGSVLVLTMNTTTDADGNYSITFNMPANSPSARYGVMMTYPGTGENYATTFNYVAG